MNEQQRTHLFREFKLQSLYSVNNTNPRKKRADEFINYKPIDTLDPPLDMEVEKGKSDELDKLLPMSIDIKYVESIFKLASNIIHEIPLIKSNKSLKFPFSKRKVLFLDLDETLVHSYLGNERSLECDIMVDANKYVSLRPNLEEFISSVGSAYDLVIYSSGALSYIEDIIDEFDPERMYITGVMSIIDCVVYKGCILKVLNGIEGIDASSYILVDDNIANVLANPQNSILISPYSNAKSDCELLKLQKFLLTKANCVDIRKEIKEIFTLHELNEKLQ